MNDQEQIRSLLDRYETSLNESDVDAAVALYATTGSKGQVTILSGNVKAPEENREFFVFRKIDGDLKVARYMFNKTS